MHKLRILAFIAVHLSIVAVVSAQPYAYVTNLGSNSLAVVNTANSSMVASIIVPSGPTGVGVTPDGSTVYVASQNTNSVSAINTSSNSVIASIGVCTTPTQLAVNPNASQVFVICQDSNQVAVIDTGSKSVSATIPVGSRPTGVAFNASGTRAYVANLWSGNVSVIDTASKSIANTFGAASGPAAVAVSPDGGSVYVANEYSNTITVHDAWGTVQNTIGVNFPNSLAMTPNGSRLIVTNGNISAASVIDTNSKSVIATLGVGLLPTAVAVSPDGGHAYVTNEFGLSVSVIDTGSNSVVNTIPSIGVYPVGVAMAAPAAAVAWQPAPSPAAAPANSCIGSVGTDHWKGEYFNNMYLSGSPVMVRDEGAGYFLRFDWGYEGSPNGGCGVPGAQFSVRWTRSITFSAATTRFWTNSDDGMRLYIDGQLVLDRWFDQSVNWRSVDVPMSGGTHNVVVEYYQDRGGSGAGLNWEYLPW